MSKNNGYEAFRKNVQTEKKLMTGKMCPISPNIPTRMTREGFVRACKCIRVSDKCKIDTGYWHCPECKSKSAIDRGRKFSPPFDNIQFITLSDFKTKFPVEEVAVLIQSRKAKGEYPTLTREIAEFIREWHEMHPEISIAAKAKMLGGISRRQVSRIIHRERWK